MPMGTSRLHLSSCPRKRRARVGSESNPADIAILNMAVDSQSLFRRRAPGLSTGRENKATDDVLRSLLSQANRDLAKLLRDVRTESGGTMLGDATSRQVSELLMRAVRCAAKQYMLQAELGNLALTDELTGLSNRRGFMALAERQLKLGRRTDRGLLLFMIDVDRLKQINDSFGHPEGDCVLKLTAGVLEETFRDSDVVARLGGDEFAVLAIEAAGHSEASIRARLFERLKSISGEHARYEISLSLGVVRFDPRSCASIGELMAKADQDMYEHKRRRSRPVIEMEPSV
jgi:diguanylate cyclase (GGDEF)-like protein